MTAVIRDVSLFYLFRHLASTKADFARLGGELGGKLRGQVHLLRGPAGLDTAFLWCDQNP